MYRVITTSYEYVSDPEAAYELALKGRHEGKRTKIITEEEYQTTIFPVDEPQQDLLLWRRQNMFGLPS